MDESNAPTATGNIKALGAGLGIVLKPMIAIGGAIYFFASGSPITACVFAVWAFSNLPTALIFGALSVYFK